MSTFFMPWPWFVGTGSGLDHTSVFRSFLVRVMLFAKMLYHPRVPRAMSTIDSSEPGFVRKKKVHFLLNKIIWSKSNTAPTTKSTIDTVDFALNLHMP